MLYFCCNVQYPKTILTMKRISFFLTIAGLFAFISCSSPAEKKVEKVEEVVEEVVEQDTLELEEVEEVVEEVVD